MPVIDASVALKWFVQEPDSPEAVRLRDLHISEEEPLLAPDLLVYEVANVLLHNRRFTPPKVSQALQALYDLQIELIRPTAPLVDRAVELAGRYKLTFYDALYVALAQVIEAKLVTADRRLTERLTDLSFVKLLG